MYKTETSFASTWFFKQSFSPMLTNVIREAYSTNLFLLTRMRGLRLFLKKISIFHVIFRPVFVVCFELLFDHMLE